MGKAEPALEPGANQWEQLTSTLQTSISSFSARPSLPRPFFSRSSFKMGIGEVDIFLPEHTASHPYGSNLDSSENLTRHELQENWLCINCEWHQLMAGTDRVDETRSALHAMFRHGHWSILRMSLYTLIRHTLNINVSIPLLLSLRQKMSQHLDPEFSTNRSVSADTSFTHT